MSGRPLLALAALLAAAALAPAPAAAQDSDRCGGAPCIQVGTFNIEWLGHPERHAPRSRRVVRQLADLVSRTRDLEVVVLQEIDTRSQEFRWLEEALGRRGWRLAHGPGGDQEVVMAWDADEVTLLEGGVREIAMRDAFDFGDGCRSRGLRRPLVAGFRAGSFDFVVVGLHLKSQRGGDCADRVRTAQAAELRDSLAVLVQGPEQDLVVAGDFNATLDDPSLEPLLSWGLVPATAPERRHPASADVSYLEEPYRSLIDHVMVRSATLPELVERSGFAFQAPRDERLFARYLRYLSDHAPVWASFRTGRDDD